MHGDIKEHEVDKVYVDFATKHRGHVSRLEVAAGEWGLVLHCPRCEDWQTFEVDNEARREALRAQGGWICDDAERHEFLDHLIAELERAR